MPCFIQPSSMSRASLCITVSKLGTAPTKPSSSITVRKRSAALCARANAMPCSAATRAVLLASTATRIFV
nr:hypothetical protein [Thiomonas sp.]